MAKRLVIVPYDSQWPVLNERERDTIRRAVGEWLVAIEHVGSTAVPGLGAKPIINIMGAPDAELAARYGHPESRQVHMGRFSVMSCTG